MSEISQNLKIIFIGTPEFGATVLKGLIDAEYKPVLVITETDKPVGRKQIVTPSPVKVIAQKYGIEILQPEKLKTINPSTSSSLRLSESNDLSSGPKGYKLKTLQPDLIVVAAYGQIIPKDILDIPKYGCLNVHPSLLPKYRGPSPIQATILNGDKETGVTIMKMDEKMDHGKIWKVEISQRIKSGEVLRLRSQPYLSC